MLDFLEKCSDPIYAYIRDTFDTYEMMRTKVTLRVNEVKKIKEDRGNLCPEIRYRWNLCKVTNVQTFVRIVLTVIVNVRNFLLLQECRIPKAGLPLLSHFHKPTISRDPINRNPGKRDLVT